MTPQAVASLRSLTGRAISLAGRSTRPAICPDLTVFSNLQHIWMFEDGFFLQRQEQKPRFQRRAYGAK
ncbi:hypothetical protein [Pseudomonas coronafaciens]|uniref:hypothetical protein n=1 Tax=Pseudomonas coronafaciens TaxID=53409 RepID=UPI0013C2B056|nr:hypothetical protein [Pseudomonas coronafaciens]